MRKFSLGESAVQPQAESAVLEVFRSGQFSPGAKVREFEERFAALHRAQFGVFVNSGTDALRCALLALKEKYAWPDGSLVAVPALTFVSTINVVLQAGLTPFVADVNESDYNLNPYALLNRIRNVRLQTKIVAVMPVHLFGRHCASMIYGIAKEREWKILEDSCETILNPLQGNVGCHSFYMAHHVTTGVGGMALTNDPHLAVLMRSYSNHGRDWGYLPSDKSVDIKPELLKSRFRFLRSGYSSRGTEFEAVLGLAQLDGLEENVKKRRFIFQLLYEELSPLKELVVYPVGQNNTAMMFPIMLKWGSAADKWDLCLKLEEGGIETREMLPITNQPVYSRWIAEENYPIARAVNDRGFYIPCLPSMTRNDVEKISEFFGQILTNKDLGVRVSAAPG